MARYRITCMTRGRVTGQWNVTADSSRDAVDYICQKYNISENRGDRLSSYRLPDKQGFFEWLMS